MELFEKSQYLGLEIQKEKNLKVFSKIALIISLIGNAICVFGALMIGAKKHFTEELFTLIMVGIIGTIVSLLIYFFIMVIIEISLNLKIRIYNLAQK